MAIFRRSILNQPTDHHYCAQTDKQPFPPGIAGYPAHLIRQEQSAHENQSETGK
jgi:hypothetical protein